MSVVHPLEFGWWTLDEVHQCELTTAQEHGGHFVQHLLKGHSVGKVHLHTGERGSEFPRQSGIKMSESGRATHMQLIQSFQGGGRVVARVQDSQVSNRHFHQREAAAI